MSIEPMNDDPSVFCLQEFEDLMQEFERAARDGNLTEFRRLDHILRSKALAVIGGMPDMNPSDERYVGALKDAVARLGLAAGEIQLERQQLKARRESDRRVRLAYSHRKGVIK
ncbi:hypothetical protein TG4357_03639 [Thalassovita gelatinovora]|uniref:Uncharacterized protein n=1 Tax=Thalassovita gelatinovora TaxID=53501 RepID=A0A0P1FK77_THAGE|nr:hypothetical protein [Thalassovita gelatinovora]QIZ78984.1 hypothetical protein HFZ77_00080 [Thalassovita gelatinovora]CUH68513.1 hypothetical protein TG4357_03639 [Thalassovita gelatinovora]SEQ53834.1 hypothetical protein SAMN04488043_106100 [Thalassovita gelatinovora]